MITERQQEQASLYALGALMDTEEAAFVREMADNPQLKQLVRTLRETTHLLLQTVPRHQPAADLKRRIMTRVEQEPQEPTSSAAITEIRRPSPETIGLAFVAAADPGGWKALPIPGAWIKLLSVNRDAGYVVALGRLEPNTRYPAHTHTGSEDLFLLTGDLRVGNHPMQPGDFCHADSGTEHEDNCSVNGCTLLAILSTDHALARFALAD